MLVQQTRQKVVRSTLNASTSKQLWSFGRKQRFKRIKTECPYAYYPCNISTLTQKQVSFPRSQRRAMTQAIESPNPASYQLQGRKSIRGGVMGQSREKVKANNYIPAKQGSAGPSDYNPQQSKRKAVSMRPKTATSATHRNYFIDDKERQAVPGPQTYDLVNPTQTNCSKYKSNRMGLTGLMTRVERFSEGSVRSPGPSQYTPGRAGMRSTSTGGKMTSSVRQSFIDRIRKKDPAPGPGNYDLPSQFGHYAAHGGRALSMSQLAV